MARGAGIARDAASGSPAPVVTRGRLLLQTVRVRLLRRQDPALRMMFVLTPSGGHSLCCDAPCEERPSPLLPDNAPASMKDRLNELVRGYEVCPASDPQRQPERSAAARP